MFYLVVSYFGLVWDESVRKVDIKRCETIEESMKAKAYKVAFQVFPSRDITQVKFID